MNINLPHACSTKIETGRFWKLFSTWQGCLRARNYFCQESDYCTGTLRGQRWEHNNHYLYRGHLHFLFHLEKLCPTQKSLVSCSYWVCEICPVQSKLCFQYKICIWLKTSRPKREKKNKVKYIIIDFLYWVYVKMIV